MVSTQEPRMQVRGFFIIVFGKKSCTYGVDRAVRIVWYLSDLEFHPVVGDERHGMRISGRFDDSAADS